MGIMLIYLYPLRVYNGKGAKPLLNIFKDGEKRTVLFLMISLPGLIISFFDIGSLPVDAAWIAILLCGIPIVKEAVTGLVTEFDIKADVLVSIALVASVIIGETFAAGEVAFIMTIGAYLEERTVAKARAGIEGLIKMTPSTARLLKGGKESVVPAAEVLAGDILRVLPGETIAVDGVILKGQTSIDQSVMTGEALPVDKKEGDKVSSGTVNQFGSFDMKAEKVGEDSSFQRLVRLVESADAGKAKIVGVADRFATWIVVIALLSAGITWFITGEIIRSVTVLVVFCPCALVLATPTAIMAAIGNASKYGILIREGDALERLSKVKCIAFDKTGTITYGKLAVSAVVPIEDISAKDLLEMAAAVEQRSEHPLGKAIVKHYNNLSEAAPAETEDFKMYTGMGVTAVCRGKRVYAGNENLLKEYAIVVPEKLKKESEAARENGGTVIFLATEEKAVGLIALSDTLRPQIADIVAKIHKTGIETLLLTGDEKKAGVHMGTRAGISKIHTNCLPEDKLSFIKDYEKKGEPVCMIGDGINDAPALKTAHVGIAMGGIGSDVAIEAADMAFISDDIKELPHLLKLSKQMMKTIKINLTASMALNFLAIALAITGILNPVLGALVHNVGSVAVITSSSLLLKWRS